MPKDSFYWMITIMIYLGGIAFGAIALIVIWNLIKSIIKPD
jgi:hypothetical protein